MTTNKNVLPFLHCCLAIAGFYALNAVAQGTKVDVCHIPPGNPENAHTITISENALDAHLEHDDQLGECEPSSSGELVPVPDPEPTSDLESAADPDPTVNLHEPKDRPVSSCACPKPGVWRVTNQDGWMECNVLGIKRKLKGADKNDGAIWILDDDCSTIFSEAYKKDHDDVLSERGRECLFFAVVPGEEDGADALFDIAYKLETEESISGESYLEMSGGGMSCSGFRPFKIDYLEPLSEKKFAKLEKKMQEKLEIERAELDEHRELIDEYLEKTGGGKAFGGRNGPEQGR